MQSPKANICLQHGWFYMTNEMIWNVKWYDINNAFSALWTPCVGIYQWIHITKRQFCFDILFGLCNRSPFNDGKIPPGYSVARMCLTFWMVKYIHKYICRQTKKYITHRQGQQLWTERRQSASLFQNYNLAVDNLVSRNLHWNRCRQR